jgi:RNA polymerase sigma factor (sigma-70 family)
MKVYLSTEDRITRRREIETLCNIANLLPVHKRMLLHLYYRDGYTHAQIGQLIMKSAVTVSRRIEHARRDALAIRDGTIKAKKGRSKCEQV